jgi:ATP-binding protein involved in chromosome partitioning
MVWRGPIIASACIQLFYNVVWGELDYLIVDLPPGTGDIQLTISEKISVAGSVIVTTPQKMAIADVIRAKSMFDKISVNILGTVENMSYFVCDGCEKKHNIFPSVNVKKMSSSLGLNFLGKIPISQQLALDSDNGSFTLLENKDSNLYLSFKVLSQLIATKIAEIAEKKKLDKESVIKNKSNTLLVL